jgi:hypothetical protein
MQDRGALFAVAIPLLAFKVWFAILLFVYAPTHDAAVWIAATHWPLIIVVLLLVTPTVAAYRLLRARARRQRLLRAEWMISDPRAAPAPARQHQ